MTAPVVDDPLTWCVADALRQCLCDTLPEVSAPVGCCCTMPGSMVTADSCETGQAWVRLAQVYPLSGRFPQAATGAEPDACGSAGFGWAGVFELGVLRCMPQPDGRGNLPSCEAYTDTDRLIQADGHAMRRAALCCGWRAACGIPNNRIALGTWEPAGPEGNCVGGSMTVTVELTGCVCNA